MTLLERQELDLVEPGPVRRDGRELAVGVQGRVAVAGKVLGRGDHAVLLGALDEGDGHPADVLRVLADGTGVDDGIVRIDVDVDDRGVILVDADGPGFERRDAPHRIGQDLRSGAPRDISGGKSVAPPILLPVPLSRSAEMRRGILASRWRRFSRMAAS